MRTNKIQKAKRISFSKIHNQTEPGQIESTVRITRKRQLTQHKRISHCRPNQRAINFLQHQNNDFVP